MDKRNILFIGGDERQLHCASYLYRIGYEVSIIGFEKYAEIIVNPMKNILSSFIGVSNIVLAK